MAGLGKRRPSRVRTRGSGLQRRESSRSETPALADASSVVIERLAHDGRGLAYAADGKAQFVEGALPGERVETAIHRTRKRFDEAHVRRLVEASPERVTPPYPDYARCGGCDVQHLAVDAQRRHKVSVFLELLARQGVELDMVPDLIAVAEEGYRRRVRLGIKVDAEGQVHMGFRARRSQRLVDIEDCTIMVPALGALLTPLRDLVATLEAPRHLGHLELLACDQGVVLVLRQLKDHAADTHRWRELAEAHDLHLARWLGRGTPVLEWLTPSPALSYGVPGPAAGDLTLGFAPGDFLQANASVNRRMVATAMAWLGDVEGQSWLDLFAGVGNFSLPLAAAGAVVTAVEGNPSMVRRLDDNARANGLVVRARQEDLARPGVVAALLAEHVPDAMLLDPPRGGAYPACRALVGQPVSRVLYVACDPATLARDAACLVHEGYRIVRAAVIDMFVHTSHLESMLLFELPKKQRQPQGARPDG